MTAVTDRLFRAVLQLIGPFIVYGLLANATIGLVNKLAPQIPIYFVSLPALIFGGLVLLYIVFPTFLMRFARDLSGDLHGLTARVAKGIA